jgi:hypothetical protein
MVSPARAVALTGWLLSAVACGGGDTAPSGEAGAPGDERTTATATLETGANLLQAKAPVEQISMYLDGFHAAKDDPAMQMEAHHYCNQMSEEFTQCVLFDGNTAEARMMGVEYIISETLYGQLPGSEKAYWHPHNYELLSGQLRMPGLPDVAEKAALKGKMNSYGKTWHTWHTGMFQKPGDVLPMGPAVLQWSFNQDGEDMPGMVAGRDKRMAFDTAKERSERAEWVPLARPQGGVDAMKGRFANAKGTAPGVADNGDSATRAVPRLSIAAADSLAQALRKQ